MTEVTKREVLEETLEIFSANKRCFSKGMRSLIPREGYEKAFHTEEEKMQFDQGDDAGGGGD